MRSLSLFALLVSPLLGLGQSAWINEFHYDNVGQDKGEGVEVVIDTTLIDWKHVYLTAYNGSNGKSYGGHKAMLNADSSSAVLAFKIFWFRFPGLQNGPKDGLCLFGRSNGSDSLLQFISYEGVLQASDGPADSFSSIDIGISENSSTALHQSLQLQGYGLNFNNFQWISDSSSPAVQNEHQGFFIPLSWASHSAHFKLIYTHPGALLYKDYQDTSAQGLRLAEISIYDGSPADTDTLITEITKFCLALNNAHILSRIELQSAAKDTVVIRNPQLENWVYPSDWIVGDDDSLRLKIYGWFKKLQKDKEPLEIGLKGIETSTNSSHLRHSHIDIMDTNSNWIEVHASRLDPHNLPDTLFARVPCPFFYALAIDTFGNLDSDYNDYLKYHTNVPNFGIDSVPFNHGKASFGGKVLHGDNQWYNLSLVSKLGAYSDSFYLQAPSFSRKLLITGLYDGPLAWGQPKGIELYALDSVADLSQYAIGVANNGAGTDGPEIQLLAHSLAPGEFYYLCSDSLAFASFFGFSPNQSHGSMNVNGDDALELYYDSLGIFQGKEQCVERFGDPNQAAVEWNYKDKWAYRKSGRIDTSFDYQDWYFSASGKFATASTNILVKQPFPKASYQPYPFHADIVYDGRSWYPFAPVGNYPSSSVQILKGITRLDQDFKVRSLDIADQARLELDEGVQMSILDHLQMDGELELWNHAAVITNDTTSWTTKGSLSVNREIAVPDHRRYTFWSSPVQEAKFFTVFGSGSNKLSNARDWYYWSSHEQQWKSCADTTVLKPGRGYISTPSPQSSPNRSIRETRIFEGKPNSGTLKIYEPHQAGDYLLLGNPYPAPLDKQRFMAANPSLDGNVYLWDNSLSYNSQAFAVWNSTNRLAASPSAQLPDSSLGIAQGFFVRALVPADSISFHPSMQVPTQPNRYKSQVTLSLAIFKDREEAHSKVFQRSSPGSSFVQSEDALWKDSGSDLALVPSVQGELYSLKGVNLVSRDTIHLYSRLDSGWHRISMESTFSAPVYLIDLDQDLVWPIGRYDYNFYSVSKSEGLRFKLLWDIGQVDLKSSTISKAEKISLYQRERALVWNSPEELSRALLFDSDGRLILDTEIQPKKEGEILLPPVCQGIYTVQLLGVSSIYSLKIFLKP